MSEVLVQFDEPQSAPDGRYYTPQIWGRFVPSDGLWEAWIEFLPTDGGDPLSTARETEQLSRGDLRYWAAGLTQVYVKEALARAIAPQSHRVTRIVAALASLDSLANSEQMILETSALGRPVPVLDPFSLYSHNGEYILRQELRVLDAEQLRDIIVAYEIPDSHLADMARTFEDALVEQIVAAVQQSVGANRPDETGISARSDI